ncbi:MAG TPA: anti-anti-sigma factor [Haliea salexigens]|uniref:Anti-anti-sigma factor n=1 Tax=Haliea salexigens TaxID=287487 RepID=A0A3C1KNZ7_9GAMM|nr:anti-anti-sigma factor [Haliea sp.]HAN28422.1 anti-anti-sigma factor [Haliea salexigens]
MWVMTEQLRESLSALMDDEATELELHRVLGELESDTALRQTWVRYQLARSAMAGQPVSHPRLDISRSVSAAIAAETGAKTSRSSLRERWVRPLASLAVAASVTAVVVLGGQQLYQAGSLEGQSAPVAASGVSAVGFVNSLGAVPMRASYGAQAVPQLEPAARTAYRELARQRMYQYMQEHAEHAALNSPQGLIPFARVPQIEE